MQENKSIKGIKKNQPNPNSTDEKNHNENSFSEFIKKLEYYKSQNGDYYVTINAPESEVYGNFIIKSEAFNSVLWTLANRMDGEVLEEKEIKTIKNRCYALANIQSRDYYFNNRIAYKEKSIFYDLCNSKYKVLEISAAGVIFTDKPNIAIKFIVNDDMNEQISPNLNADESKYLELLNRHFNFKNNDDLLLFAVYIISCFIQHNGRF